MCVCFVGLSEGLIAMKTIKSSLMKVIRIVVGLKTHLESMVTAWRANNSQSIFYQEYYSEYKEEK